MLCSGLGSEGDEREQRDDEYSDADDEGWRYGWVFGCGVFRLAFTFGLVRERRVDACFLQDSF